MGKRDKLILAAVIWAVVYPSVTALSYGMDWLVPELPKWAVLLITTVFTVSLIEFVVTDWAERLVAKRRGQSKADLMRDRAEAAEK